MGSYIIMMVGAKARSLVITNTSDELIIILFISRYFFQQQKQTANDNYHVTNQNTNL